MALLFYRSPLMAFWIQPDHACPLNSAHWILYGRPAPPLPRLAGCHDLFVSRDLESLRCFLGSPYSFPLSGPASLVSTALLNTRECSRSTLSLRLTSLSLTLLMPPAVHSVPSGGVSADGALLRDKVRPTSTHPFTHRAATNVTLIIASHRNSSSSGSPAPCSSGTFCLSRCPPLSSLKASLK